MDDAAFWKRAQELVEIEDYDSLAELFQHKVDEAVAKKDLKTAFVWCKRGIDQLVRTEQFYKAAVMMNRLALLYLSQKDLLNAGRLFYRAAQQCERGRAFSEASANYKNSAECFYKLGENFIIEAAKHYKLAAIALIQFHDYEKLEYRQLVDRSDQIFKEAYEKKLLSKPDYYLYLENLYGDIQNVLYRNGYYRDVSEVYIKMMHNVKNRFKSDPRSFLLYLWFVFWDWSSGYGEKPFRWLGTIFASLLVFALVYWKFGLVAGAATVKASFLECLFFALNMFASLGYGNDFIIYPVTRLIAMVNVVFGYVMLAVLLTVISRKITR
ncbi:MAG: potassium channel family protein [Candidatus Omnitrophica bacterium]|nr:potassium channel family protein [Candidatus Omnitrophota bacterium]